MSKNKGFSETSASRYSLALYELATESKVLNEVEEHSFSIINVIEKSEDFKSLIKDPTNKIEDQLNALNKICEKYSLNELLAKFFRFLISKRRFFFCREDIKRFYWDLFKKKRWVKSRTNSCKRAYWKWNW